MIHIFGGIGGPDGEAHQRLHGHRPLRLRPGHVIGRSLHRASPALRLRYHQIYANNPNGIVAGSQDWSAYMGNLQRGWLGTRPVSDVLVRDTFGLPARLSCWMNWRSRRRC